MEKFHGRFKGSSWQGYYNELKLNLEIKQKNQMSIEIKYKKVFISALF